MRPGPKPGLTVPPVLSTLPVMVPAPSRACRLATGGYLPTRVSLEVAARQACAARRLEDKASLVQRACLHLDQAAIGETAAPAKKFKVAVPVLPDLMIAPRLLKTPTLLPLSPSVPLFRMLITPPGRLLKVACARVMLPAARQVGCAVVVDHTPVLRERVD